MLPFNELPSPHHPAFDSFFPLVKQRWESSFKKTFSSSTNFCFTSPIDSNWNWIPLKADLIFEKRKKLQGAKSGEYGACLSTGVPPAAK